MPSPSLTRGTSRFSPKCTAILISSSSGVVEEQDAERPVVDEPLGELRDAREQLIEIEDGRDLAADLGQRLERLGVEAALLEESGVDERDRDVRRELAQDRDVVAAEVIRGAG